MGYVVHKVVRYALTHGNDLPDDCFAVVASGGEKDDQGKTVPRTLRKLPYKNAQGNIDLPHLRNALARVNQIEPASLIPAAKKKLCAAARSEKAEDLVSEFCGEESAQEQQGNQEPEKDEHGCIVGKEKWDEEQGKCVLISTEQQGNQEPEKDEHGCVIGKERWDPEGEKCVPIATEQQGNGESEKDEHGCIIGKERWDPDQEKCVAIATEQKKKGLGEAIIDPGAPPQPTLIVPVEKLEAKMPPLQAERSMSLGAQRFVQDVKKLIREAKEESKSG